MPLGSARLVGVGILFMGLGLAPPAAGTPAPSSGLLSPDQLTPEGYPRTLHVQLERGLKATYLLRVTSGRSPLSCPFPLSPVTGCDLRPVDAGPLSYTLSEGDRQPHAGQLVIPPLGAAVKVTRRPPEWVERLGYGLLGFGAFSSLAMGAWWGIDHYGPDDTIAQAALGVSIPLFIAGVLLVALPWPPELRYLAPDDAVIPAPP